MPHNPGPQAVARPALLSDELAHRQWYTSKRLRQLGQLPEVNNTDRYLPGCHLAELSGTSTAALQI